MGRMSAALGTNETIDEAEQVVNIESAMKQQPGSYPIPIPSGLELLKPILTEAFISQHLVGNTILSIEQRTKIHEVATEALYSALKNIYLKNYGLDDFKCDALVLETALLLRNWNDCSSDDGDDDMNFWEYICNQYALTYDKGFGNSYSYKIFKHVINRSLKLHK